MFLYQSDWWQAFFDGPPCPILSSSCSIDTVIIMMMVKRLINDDFLPKNEELLSMLSVLAKGKSGTDRHISEYDIRKFSNFSQKRNLSN